MREVILALVGPLVRHPEALELSEVPGRAEPKFLLALDREDIGRVIGRDGRTIKAIRALLGAAAAAQRVEEPRLDVEEKKSQA
jgi:predicted RNA-binding protein YlqC (UPF0109 family)